MAFEVRDLMVDVFPNRNELADDRCHDPASHCHHDTGACTQDTIIHVPCDEISMVECTQITKGQGPCPEDSVEPGERTEDWRRLAPLAVLREQLQLALRS
jgi:hypothetical protein